MSEFVEQNKEEVIKAIEDPVVIAEVPKKPSRSNKTKNKPEQIENRIEELKDIPKVEEQV